MDAMLCRSCSWFGVYGEDVIARMRGCPVCGSTSVSIRDTDADEWRQLGRELLEGEPNDSAGDRLDSR